MSRFWGLPLIFCAPPHFNFMELKWRPKKVGAQKNFLALCAGNRPPLSICFLRPWIVIFDLFALVILTLTRWPSYTNLTPSHRDIPAVRKWISHVKAFESYRITDRQTDTCHRNYMPHFFAGGQKFNKHILRRWILRSWFQVFLVLQ